MTLLFGEYLPILGKPKLSVCIKINQNCTDVLM